MPQASGVDRELDLRPEHARDPLLGLWCAHYVRPPPQAHPRGEVAKRTRGRQSEPDRPGGELATQRGWAWGGGRTASRRSLGLPGACSG